MVFKKNQRQCASFSIIVAILFLSFKWITTVHNKLTESQFTNGSEGKYWSYSVHSRIAPGVDKIWTGPNWITDWITDRKEKKGFESKKIKL